MQVHISSASSANVILYALDNTTIDNIASKVGKKLNKNPETLIFFYKGKCLSKNQKLSDIKYVEGEIITMQCLLNEDNKTKINFDAYDIMGHMALNFLQKQLFSSPEIIRTAKAIYSKEHRNPEIQRTTDPENFAELMSQLEALGFPSVRCANALRRADFCIDLAASLLMDNQEGIQELTEIIDLVQCVEDTDSLTKVESIQTPPRYQGVYYVPDDYLETDETSSLHDENDFQYDHEYSDEELYSPAPPRVVRSSDSIPSISMNSPPQYSNIKNSPILYSSDDEYDDYDEMQITPPLKQPFIMKPTMEPPKSLEEPPKQNCFTTKTPLQTPKRVKPTPKVPIASPKNKIPSLRASMTIPTPNKGSPQAPIKKITSVQKVSNRLSTPSSKVRSSLPKLQRP